MEMKKKRHWTRGKSPGVGGGHRGGKTTFSQDKGKGNDTTLTMRIRGRGERLGNSLLMPKNGVCKERR